MDLNEDLRRLATAKNRLLYINNGLRMLLETDLEGLVVSFQTTANLVVERRDLTKFIDRMENEVKVKFLVNKHWLSLSTGKFEVLENERLCRKELDEKPFVMSYDMRNQFKIMPWHWIAWRSLRMAQIERMEAER